MAVRNNFAVTNNFTRPNDTTAYAQGDLVANSTTAGSVTPLSLGVGKGGVRINAIRLQKSGTTATNATFIVHLYSTSPTVANGDNGALSTSASGRFASVTLPTMTAHTDACIAVRNLGDTGLPDAINHLDADGYIYALISVDAAYTPVANEVFTLTVIAERA